MKNTIKLIALASVLGITSCQKEGCTDPSALNYNEKAKKEDNSCEYNTPEAPSQTEDTLYMIGSSTNTNNQTISLYSYSELSTGYTKLFVDVVDGNGDKINNATVSFAPLMDMGMMQHACPIEQPTFNTNSDLYEGSLVLIMSSMAGTWTLDVDVDGSAVQFTMNVSESDTKVVGSYTGTDGETYFVSLMRPENWVVGHNELEIMVHTRANMMSFPAVEDFDLVLYPEMVSMGHSSTGNIDPVHISNGHYEGVVNLSMPGDWRLHFELNQASTLIHSDAFLDILF